MTSSIDKRLLDSLTEYVQDIKPYHTKLKGFTTELEFSDRAVVRITDSHELTVSYTGVVDGGSPGMDSLTYISEGAEKDRTIQLPPTVIPHFSLSMNEFQTPPGDDQAQPLSNRVDGNSNLIPDSEQPFTGALTFSRQLGVTSQVPAEIELDDIGITVVATSEAGAVVSGTINLTVTASVAVFSTLFGISLAGVELYFNGAQYPVNLSSGSATILIPITFTQGADFFNDPGLATSPLSPDEKLLAWAVTRQVYARAVNGTGRYRIPFHTGSIVHVGSALQELGSDYVVSRDRSFIQFLNGRHPGVDVPLRFNLLNTDRLLLGSTLPYQAGDEYVITLDDTYPEGYSPIVFNTSAPTENTRKPQLSDVVVAPGLSNGDQFKLERVSGFRVKISKVTPLLTFVVGFAEVEKPFSSPELSFKLSLGWLDYYLANDAGSYVAFEPQPFALERQNSGSDEADFFPSPLLRTEHGTGFDPTPPLHQPVQLYEEAGRIGVIKRLASGQYVFVFDTPPAPGSYVRARVEFSTQLGSRSQAGISESLIIVSRINLGYDAESFDSYLIDDEHMLDVRRIEG